MKRSKLAVLAVALLPELALFASASSASASSATTLTMTLTEPDGSAMAGADISVYYYPPVITPGVPLQLMGEATGNSAGTVSLSLDTSMVPARDLGDVGDGGNDAFNALVVGSDPARHLIIHHEVLTLDTANGGTASAVADAAGQPIAGPSVPHGTTPTTVPDGAVASAYRYVQVLAMNSGAGMSSQLNYSYTSTTARQTVVSVPLENVGAGWGLQGSMLEQTDRTINAPWWYGGSIHQYLWASYLFLEYHIQGCNRFSCWNYYEWDPNHFQGYVTNDNPDYWKSGTKIGYVNYHVPAFTYCHGPGTCWFQMTPHNSGWGRSSGTRQTYQFELGGAGFINVTDWATYGSITRQQWWYHSSGCGSPEEEILWGYNTDPATATIVQADCLVP
jgi:hypothetical protein